MLASLAAALSLSLAPDAVAQGELRKLEPFAERIELVVRREKSNLLSRSALAELRRWPGVPVVELSPPFTRVELRALRQLPRLAVRLAAPAEVRERAALKRLGPNVIRAEAPPQLEPKAPPCAGTSLGESEGRAELRVQSAIDRCVLRWLQGQLQPAHEAPQR